MFSRGMCPNDIEDVLKLKQFFTAHLRSKLSGSDLILLPEDQAQHQLSRSSDAPEAKDQH